MSQPINKTSSLLPPPNETGVLSVSEIFAGSDKEPVGDMDKPYDPHEVIYYGDETYWQRTYRVK